LAEAEEAAEEVERTRESFSRLARLRVVVAGDEAAALSFTGDGGEGWSPAGEEGPSGGGGAAALLGLVGPFFAALAFGGLSPAACDAKNAER
jgi:hypothetical protein